MTPHNPLPLLGVVLAVFLASGALVREPVVAPLVSAPESTLALQAPDVGLALLTSQGGANNDVAERVAARRASSFIGRNIESRDGNKVGEIEDLVLDEAGRVTHAILSCGGIGSLGTRQVAIPWQVLKDRVQGNRIVIERALLEAAPALPEDDPDFTSRNWSRETDHHWERMGLAISEDATPSSTAMGSTEIRALAETASM